MTYPNTLIFVDFPSTDPEASARFYNEVFGWEVEPRPADVFYRIHLRVVDSDGLTHEVTRDVQPVTANVTLATNVPGLQLSLDGVPVAAPTSFAGVAGVTRVIGAPASTSARNVAHSVVRSTSAGRLPVSMVSSRRSIGLSRATTSKRC